MLGAILLIVTFMAVVYFLGQIDLSFMEDEAEDYWLDEKDSLDEKHKVEKKDGNIKNHNFRKYYKISV